MRADGVGPGGFGLRWMASGWRRLRLLLAVAVVAGAWSLPAADGAQASTIACTRGLSQGGCAWQSTAIVYVHGWSLGSATDCDGYWSNLVGAESALAQASAGHAPPMIRIAFYAGDTSCDSRIGSFDNDTGIEVLGLALRRFLNAAFPGQFVNLVAHSMGGLVVRSALSAALDVGAPRPRVNHVVTLSSPHEGVDPLLCVGAIVSHEVTQMCPHSSFLKSLGSTRNQSLTGTNWNTFGSEDDDVVFGRSGSVSHPDDPGFFDPDLRIDYADGVHYDHGTIVQGMPADAACQADHTNCVDGVYDTGAGPVTVTNHTLLTVFLATSRGLAGARPVG